MKDYETAERQLDRILGLFPRVEARINGLFGVNTLLLAIGSLNIDMTDLAIWFVGVPATIFIAILATSYVFLFRANYPDTKGGEGSVTYFAEIRKRTEVGFRTELLAITDSEYRDDIIGQIWRNSEILCAKFENMKKAIIATTLSLIPFVLVVIATATVHGRIPILKS